MKTLHLDVEYEFDFHLYGLVSPSKEYTLAWWLNKLLDLRLAKQKDLCYVFGAKDQLLISNFEFSTDHSIIRLFRNKALGTSMLKKPFFLPDIKEYDYVLQISGSTSSLYPTELISKVQNIPFVQYVKQFDPITLKFRNNLIF